ncbi:MAG: biopolymer transporter ExbD [Pirellulaceae bacterium]|jgi:biopolymer transport protein ExbD|nr:biopolymer transporter ExbD [Pirellulaceae bacterium]
MKFRRDLSRKEDTRLNMTAMIDIVFQLLAFFIITFKITTQETDFNIKMPLEAQGSPTDVIPDLIQVTLRSGEGRNISAIEVDNMLVQERFDGPDMFSELTNFVEKTLATSGDPTTANEVEVEFIIDKPLRYRYTIMAIEGVSGRVLPDGSTKKLVEKIKFRN